MRRNTGREAHLPRVCVHTLVHTIRALAVLTA